MRLSSIRAGHCIPLGVIRCILLKSVRCQHRLLWQTQEMMNICWLPKSFAGGVYLAVVQTGEQVQKIKLLYWK